MKIADIMSRTVLSVQPTASIGDAARLMESQRVGTLPVLDEGALVGIVTDRDLAVRAVAAGLHCGSPVLRVMTRHVETCSQDEQVEEVLDRMAFEGVRRMPVTAPDQALVGIVSLTDAAATREQRERAAETLSELSWPLVARRRGRHSGAPAHEDATGPFCKIRIV